MSEPEQEKVRYYTFDGDLAKAYFSEKLRDVCWSNLETKELIRIKEEIEKELVKRLGS